MQKFPGEMALCFSTQVLHATYNQWKKPVSGEGDLEEEDDLDVLNFPSEKLLTLSPLTV